MLQVRFKHDADRASILTNRHRVKGGTLKEALDGGAVRRAVREVIRSVREPVLLAADRTPVAGPARPVADLGSTRHEGCSARLGRSVQYIPCNITVQLNSSCCAN